MTDSPTHSDTDVRILAIDWSGAAKASEQKKKIWLAEIENEVMIRLEACRTREEIVDHLVKTRFSTNRLVVGLDFAFSFPQWFCDDEGARDPRSVWEMARDHGETWLAPATRDEPFWGRGGGKPLPEELRYRVTEFEIREQNGLPAKSVFEIGYPGSVATGSIRGMPHLLTLREAGFSIWPFDPPTLPLLIEIYPRALLHATTRPSFSCERESYLEKCHQNLGPLQRGKAIADDNAFDAATSALAMAQGLHEIRQLEPLSDPPHNIEGKIWLPEGHHRQ